MIIREITEQYEIDKLSKYAVKSKFSKGRETQEEPCDIRTCFQRDRDRIIHSKAFRRLMYKTQVFISPEDDHFRTRLTHTLEVSQIARSIAIALNLNEDLTEAISLGHDLGHTPFGHLGEDELNKISQTGFEHNKQSIRVVEKIEKNGKGLNLTYEVKDGILNHRGAGSPQTLEGKIVQLADKIAYVNHDIDDSIRAGILTLDNLPREAIAFLGESTRQRINFLIRDVIKNSINKDDIVMSDEAKMYLYDLRAYLFKNVYFGEYLSVERDRHKGILGGLYNYYMEDFEKIPLDFYKNYRTDEENEIVVCDYIASMTDRFARKKFDEIKRKSERIVE